MAAHFEPVDLVDPFIDTGKERVRWVFTAFTARPFGMVRLGPNTDPVGTWNAGYRYGSTTIACFSHIHSWQLAGVPLMPVPGVTRPSPRFADYASRYSHGTEAASPGSYSVKLLDHDVEVALTATDRVGMHRYRFPDCRVASVVMNLGAELGPCAMSDAVVRRTGPSELEGFVENDRTRRRSKRCRISFVIRFSQPIAELETLAGSSEEDGSRELGQNGGAEQAGAAWRPRAASCAVARFSVSESREVVAKVGVSYVDCDHARMNLEAEVPHWDFDRVRAESRSVWNDWLSRIIVTGGGDEHRVKLYTDLWRTLVGGHIISDVDGAYRDLTGGEPVTRYLEHGATEYPLTCGQDGLWNAQWSLSTLYGLVYPSVMSRYCNHFVTMARDGGLIPRGPSAHSYTFVMIAAPTTPFIVSAYQKGIRTFDIDAAYDGMLRNAEPGGLMSKAGYEFDSTQGGGIEYYLDLGYIPAGRTVDGAMHVDGAAQTMEYSYQDWSLAEMARALNRADDAERFLRRSQNYRSLFDRGTGFIRPRRLDGSWLEPFDPLSLEDFCEANSWQYTFHAVHDIPGLVALMDGREAFIRRLNNAFEEAQAMSFYAPKPETRRDLATVNYGNEPGRFVAHLFNHVGAPWLTQKWARLVRDRTFGGVGPYGFFEDDDNGKAAATSLLLALGLFDVSGGVSSDPVYEITAPVFESVTVRLDPSYYAGGEFRIVVEGKPTEEPYIQYAELNGRPLTAPWIRHAEVTAGGVLRIRVASKPNRSWGRG